MGTLIWLQFCSSIFDFFISVSELGSVVAVIDSIKFRN